MVFNRCGRTLGIRAHSRGAQFKCQTIVTRWVLGFNEWLYFMERIGPLRMYAFESDPYKVQGHCRETRRIQGIFLLMEDVLHNAI